MNLPMTSAFCLFLGITSAAFSQVGATAESITIHPGAVNAFTYHQCRVLKVEHDGVRIAYDRGTAHIPHQFMPPEWRAGLSGQQPQPQAIPRPQAIPQPLPQPGPPAQNFPRQENDPSKQPTPQDADATRKDMETRVQSIVSIPLHYVLEKDLTDVRIDEPPEWRDATVGTNGKVYIPWMSYLWTTVKVDEVAGWVGNQAFGKYNRHYHPTQVWLTLKAKKFRIQRANSLSSISNKMLAKSEATNEQLSEWSKLANEDQICIGMPVDIAKWVVGYSDLHEIGLIDAFCVVPPSSPWFRPRLYVGQPYPYKVYIRDSKVVGFKVLDHYPDGVPTYYITSPGLDSLFNPVWKHMRDQEDRL